ncbi:hypothetical protein HX882_07730 [Pseudomonas gingeri]|uniref:Uncharacterized protein n=1 Tax=Pseudomonas gingeri TaxID=117681 RepID=A0A7Y7XBN9_9PSED|nr:hypothetical protein [Pseudomonas gingeri]NWB95773.1 hypothetical protein [Pseudomonas gingeri]
MLTTVEEAQEYINTWCNGFPAIRGQIELLTPSDDKVLTKLVELGLPHTYLKIAKKINLHGISIGPFSLWPEFSETDNLPDSIIAATQDNVVGINLIREKNLIIVARAESDFIAIHKAQETVSHIDISSSRKFSIIEIAPNFEVFFMLAANLFKIAQELEGDTEEGTSEIIKCTNYFKCTNEQSVFWKDMAIVMTEDL